MNPRIKKIGRNILFLLAIPAIIGAFVFANSNKKNEKLSGIHLDILNTELSFVTESDLLGMIASSNVIIHKTVLNQIQVNELEKTIKKNKWVRDAQIFITSNQALNVKVRQKNPVVRINLTDSIDYAYYLDEYADPVELSEQYIAKVPVVTTNRLGYSRKDLKLKHDLVELATYIKEDSFWNAMISQINIDNKGQIELIPQLGNHLILLGTIDDLHSKMDRLLTFYTKGLNTIDWNRYNEIDLRFAQQVVARNTNMLAFEEKQIEKEPKETQSIKSKVLTTTKKETKSMEPNKTKTAPSSTPKH